MSSLAKTLSQTPSPVKNYNLRKRDSNTKIFPASMVFQQPIESCFSLPLELKHRHGIFLFLPVALIK